MAPALRAPSLGPRGEGWVIAQVALLGAIAVADYLAWNAAGRTNSWGPVLFVMGCVMVVAGGGVVFKSVLDLGNGMTVFPRPKAGAQLVQTGAYRLVRNPMYSGVLLAAFGSAIAAGSIIAVVLSFALFALFDLKSRREEVWLAASHPQYAAYRARTRRFIPFVY